MSQVETNTAKQTRAQKPQRKKVQSKPRAKRQLTSDAIKKLELEYFKKRKELERQERKALQAMRAKDVAEGKKLVGRLRKQYAMTDEQITKRLGIKQ